MELVKIENNSKYGLVVSSRVIAEKLKKKHYNVVRDLENIIQTKQNSENSNLSSLIIPNLYRSNNQKRKYKEYLLTKDGFTLYMFNIQGYIDFKMAYINKFNEMEQMLKNPKQLQINLPKSFDVDLPVKTFRGEQVWVMRDLEILTGVNHIDLNWGIISNDIYRIVLSGQALINFKNENSHLDFKYVSVLSLYPYESVKKVLGLFCNKSQNVKAKLITDDKKPYIPTETQLRQAEILAQLTQDMDIDFKTYFREYACNLVVGANDYKVYKDTVEITNFKRKMKKMDKESVIKSINKSVNSDEFRNLPESSKIYVMNMYKEILV